MSKSDRIYKIFMTSMIVIIAGLLLATGIIAIQKSMKMNLSFEANPNYLFEVYIQKSGDDTKKLVFRNYEKSASEGVVMENGFSTLYGNTLTADDTFLETYGSDFEFIIENHTKNSGMRVSVTANVETEGGHEGILPTITEDKMTATKLKDGSSADYIRFSVTTTEVVFPQTTVLNIVFSEYNEYAVGVSPSSGNFTYTANPVAIGGENYTATIKAKTGYSLEITVTRDDGATTTLTEGQGEDYVWDSSTGALTIYESAVTGDITINCLNDNAIPYTISYTLNGGSVATANPTTYTVETNAFTLTNPTKTDYDFAGWTGTGLNGATQSVTISQMTGNRSYTATWTPTQYSISYNLYGGSVATANPTAYTVETATFTLNNPTKSGYSFTGWTGSNGTTAQTSVTIAKGSTGNKSYTANWVKVYTITLNLNGGSYNESTNNITLSGAYTNLSDATGDVDNYIPTLANHTFGGWYSDVVGATSVPTTQVKYYSCNYFTDNSVSLAQDLTLTGATTLYARWLPFTVGTYSTGTDKPTESGNSVTYTAFAGYKYLKFVGVDTFTYTYNSNTTATTPLRFIVIGAGENVNSAMKGAYEQTSVTKAAFAGTLANTKDTSAVGTNTEIADNHVLLLSEQLVDRLRFTSLNWLDTSATTRNFLNESTTAANFLPGSGLDDYVTNGFIVKPSTNTENATLANGIITAWSGGTTTDNDSYIFLLGSRYGAFGSGNASANGDVVSQTDTIKERFYSQHFVVEDYLGVDTEGVTGGDLVYGDAKLKQFTGLNGTYSSLNYWQLRSGHCLWGNHMYAVNYTGQVNGNGLNQVFGVRPCFILNLA